jgi:uncharacterized protein GlcG (DUF336 family)
MLGLADSQVSPDERSTVMNLAKLVTIGGTIGLFSTSAFAQLPATKVLTLDVAQTIAEGALTKCRAEGLKVTVVVVDGLNAPKVLIRDDGSSAANAEVARMKATSVMLYDRPSGPVTAPPPGTPPIGAIPGTYNSRGAVPIKVGGMIIGAVSVSASPPGQDKDVACANAGLAKAADKLR